ncbi:MAG: hypothetical protein CMI36_16460 [Owenweeksia sp.]|nr:hypothetical protein [Micavibrio sp.]MBG00585.1 hypothetical protein [Owenweeksia sp.]HBF20704.1 hypothetical protein [Cryomorphaceae bacterium]|tara:strand:+ start:5873 stop:7006 length:1134 start_codon:yes stop_codon:yes gene_type:complete
MITVEEIRKKAERLYRQVLQTNVTGETIFPLTIRSNKRLSSDFTVMRQEIAQVMAGSKDRIGYGYTVVSKTVNTRRHGSQDMPDSIVFETKEDYLKFIGKQKEYVRFEQDYSLIQKNLPQLPSRWLEKNVMMIVQYHQQWESLIKVCQWFLHEFKPDIYYIRELPISVHTKFIEGHKKILKSLLDTLIPWLINREATEFEKRYHLKYNQPLIRYRFLDATIQSGIPYDDLGVPLEQFGNNPLNCEKVIIVENKMNYLTFPKVKSAICIWGGGFAIENLKWVPWLKDKEIYYWSDLDAQGFQMLSQLRGYYPQTQSFLMGRKVLEQFKDFIVAGTPCKAENLPGLQAEEYELYQYLQKENLRLEQERIPQTYIDRIVN